jgi:hypothetical protein
MLKPGITASPEAVANDPVGLCRVIFSPHDGIRRLGESHDVVDNALNVLAGVPLMVVVIAGAHPVTPDDPHDRVVLAVVPIVEMDDNIGIADTVVINEGWVVLFNEGKGLRGWSGNSIHSAATLADAIRQCQMNQHELTLSQST